MGGGKGNNKNAGIDYGRAARRHKQMQRMQEGARISGIPLGQREARRRADRHDISNFTRNIKRLLPWEQDRLGEWAQNHDMDWKNLSASDQNDIETVRSAIMQCRKFCYDHMRPAYTKFNSSDALTEQKQHYLDTALIESATHYDTIFDQYTLTPPGQIEILQMPFIKDGTKHRSLVEIYKRGGAPQLGIYLENRGVDLSYRARPPEYDTDYIKDIRISSSPSR